MNNIEELVTLFRQSGGRFENVELGYREKSGFYCKTLDSSQKSLISCPADLLVDCDDIGVNQDGLFVSNPDKYKNNIAFLNKYFAFHFNKKTISLYIETKNQINSLRSKDLSIISKVFPSYLYETGKCEELEFEKKQILRSHRIKYFGKDVLMPFVTFINHDKNGVPYLVSEDGISISGKFNDEVYAIYGKNDAIMIAGEYGFVTNSSMSYSIPFQTSMPNGTQVYIGRSINESAIDDNGRPRPTVKKNQNIVTISWFPLYYEGAPLYPAIVASIVATETGLSAAVLLHIINSYNLNALIPAAFQLSKSKSRFAQLIAAAAQMQLETIGRTRHRDS